MTTRAEVIADVTALVNSRYGGDWRKAFDAKDADGDGRLSRKEIVALLADAMDLSLLDRWAAATAILREMDADSDGCVSYREFEAKMKA